MSRPPIKAFETIRDYCKNNRSCEGCPLHHDEEGAFCVTYPELWQIKKEGEASDKDPDNR